ncbi:MAG: DUF2254 domain-containing protein [Candidatus Eremiobacteraeota bacterium]|nr:DUF2254 domain-containing protein [Candidatus Eremiobacteraeota bacterium]MBV8331185.1 DUF2254 domain-containing protein [Candidatus Eremiobacteraeota bacterium]MBV8433357.1 DUF2254 domain-containing protein [Candidatus Eremiobacteraeota bacterium]
MPGWLIPAVYVVVSFCAALALPRIEYANFPAYGDAMSVSTAQALLGAISSGMMAFTGIVFSIAFLLIQYTATAFSKRFILTLRRSRLIFHALGLFVATFTFALGTLAFVDRQGRNWVPIDSIALTGTLLFASIVILAVLIKQLADLRVTRIIAYIGDGGRALVARMPKLHNAADGAPARSGNARIEMVDGDSPRVVASIDRATLVSVATAGDVTIRLMNATGDSVYPGEVLATIEGSGGVDARALRRCIELAPENFFRSDVRFSLRLLVDAAIMALSPAVNDPTTAVEALDQIADLLLRLGRADLETGRAADDNGIVRLVYPAPTWEDYLSLALDEIRLYGRESLQVVRRMRAALSLIAGAIDAGPKRDVVLHYRARLDAQTEAVFSDPSDRAVALGSDPQGLGLARG